MLLDQANIETNLSKFVYRYKPKTSHASIQLLVRKLRGSSTAMRRTLAALLAICLLCIIIRCNAGEGQHQQLPASNPNACLRAAFTSGLKDRSVYSQVGEDGILETIFSCIGARSKYYVEFGTEDGTQCSTRLLREEKGWTGLLLDGGYKIPELNLNQEMITAEDIVQVFEKYAVPKPLLVRKQQLQVSARTTSYVQIVGGLGQHAMLKDVCRQRTAVRRCRCVGCTTGKGHTLDRSVTEEKKDREGRTMHGKNSGRSSSKRCKLIHALPFC